MLLNNLLLIVFALGVLVWSADRFVVGAACIAHHLRLPPLLIGLTIVAIGTSAPELLVSIFAALENNAELSIGNAIGSNIVNFALILGITALIRPLTVHASLLRRELPLLLVVIVIVGLMFMNGQFGRIDGAILLLGLVAYLSWLIYNSFHPKSGDMNIADHETPQSKKISFARAILWFVVGLALLLYSAHLLVEQTTLLAKSLGISDLIIGLTIVAIGTSLPELAASLAGAIKKQDDIAIGNLVGSNLFNLLGVLAFPGLLAPGALPAGILDRDFWMMLVTTVFVTAICLIQKEPKIGRTSAITLLVIYGLYLFLLLSYPK